MTVPAPKADPLDEPDAVVPRPHGDLVADLMEARDCDKAAAEDWIAAHGADAAERVIRARWTFAGRERWGGGE
jgi:hypothetical protein